MSVRIWPTATPTKVETVREKDGSITLLTYVWTKKGWKLVDSRQE